uniref:Ovule protein n=1 Tax=Heterorhabditis bacteriophora TaxID=37862 RepID=A0A1I7W947_HETBA
MDTDFILFIFTYDFRHSESLYNPQDLRPVFSTGSPLKTSSTFINRQIAPGVSERQKLNNYWIFSSRLVLDQSRVGLTILLVYAVECQCLCFGMNVEPFDHNVRIYVNGYLYRYLSNTLIFVPLFKINHRQFFVFSICCLKY